MFNKGKTVDGILSNFRKTVEQLRTHALERHEKCNQRLSEVDRLREQISAHFEANAADQLEAGRAIHAADNISDIIG